jgi:hypothetical protein
LGVSEGSDSEVMRCKQCLQLRGGTTARPRPPSRVWVVLGTYRVGRLPRQLCKTFLAWAWGENGGLLRPRQGHHPAPNARTTLSARCKGELLGCVFVSTVWARVLANARALRCGCVVLSGVVVWPSLPQRAIARGTQHPLLPLASLRARKPICVAFYLELMEQCGRYLARCEGGGAV